MRVFDVTRNNQNFRFVDSPVAIRFTQIPKLDKIAETMNPLHVEFFRFSDYEQLILLTNTNTDLPGVFRFRFFSAIPEK